MSTVGSNYNVTQTNHPTCEVNSYHAKVDPQCSTHLQNHGSNNQYAGCPAIMFDGRQFTDYRSASHANYADQQRIKKVNGPNIKSHHDEKLYHINHATTILNDHSNHIHAAMNCNCCDDICQKRKNPSPPEHQILDPTRFPHH